jgi:membrane-associated protein
VGRHGFLNKYARRLGFTMERLQKIERHFQRHAIRTLVISKFAQGIGSLAWIASGIAKVPFKKFLTVNTLTTAVKSMILLLIGYYFGKSYEKFNSYLNIFGLCMIGIVALYLILVQSDAFKKFIDKSED